MVTSPKDFGKRVRSARKQRRLTQQELADHLGKTSAAISELERGRVQVSARDLASLAELLGKPIEYFYGEDFEGDDIQDLIAMIRRMDKANRRNLLVTIQAMASMQDIAAAIKSTDENDEEAQLKLANNFYSALQPFLDSVGSIYEQGRELATRLSQIPDVKETNLDN